MELLDTEIITTRIFWVASYTVGMFASMNDPGHTPMKPGFIFDLPFLAPLGLGYRDIYN